MNNFIADIEDKKGELVFNSNVDSIHSENEKIKFSINKNNFFSTKILINCSGLGSHLLASTMKKLNKKHIPQIYLVKGSYMKLSGKSPFKN